MLSTRSTRGRLAVLALPAVMVACLWGFTREASAQAPDTASAAATVAAADAQGKAEPAADSGPPTMFPHNDGTRYFLAGQANIILQGHGPFDSPYEGQNSLLSRGEYKTSLVGTLFMGYQLRRDPRTATDFIYDEEIAVGRGISEAVGLGGFTNLDVVRNPNLGKLPYYARIQLHQTIGFTGKMVETSRTPFSLSTEAPERRVELHLGKIGIPDFFDLNSVGTDSHLQFLNWTVDNNGAWDYAADTRGYTYGLVTEYIDKQWSARYAVALMPIVANGIDLDWNLRRANGQNMEFEWRHGPLGRLLKPGRKGAVRVLSYVNHAHMGLYRDAVKAYLAGEDPTPEITLHEKYGAVKYGFTLNTEQEVTDNLRVFGRFGWNEGQHESYAYTEVDQTVLFGGDYSGRRWGRENDKVGVAFVSNAIKRDHQEYLRLGGLGFLLGDGRLNYAREDILEGYYTVHTWKGLSYALDAQYINHPGYNQDRGPVLVESVRMHVDF